MNSVVCAVLLLANIAAVCRGFQWVDLQGDKPVIFACKNGTLVLPWSVAVPNGERIIDIQWYHEPSDGRPEEMMAMFSHGNFAPLANFATRVEMYSNAGLIIHSATSADDGNYTAEVNGLTAGGSFVSLNKTASVQTNGGILSGALHAQMEPMAVFDAATHAFHVVLTCGTFGFQATALPYQVQWITPTGSTLPSTSYKNGIFELTLPHHMASGDYTCHIPDINACSHDMGATVTINSIEARLIILESENKRLSSLNGMLVSQIDHLQHNYTDLANQLHTVAAASTNSSKQHPAFLVHLTSEMTRHHQEAIEFNDVFLNQGAGYNMTTGQFTAPEDGIYAFSVSTLAPRSTDAAPIYADAEIVVDGTMILCRVFSHTRGEMGSCNAAARLRHGQKVWARAYGGSSDSYQPPMTSFTGYWVSP